MSPFKNDFNFEDQNKKVKEILTDKPLIGFCGAPLTLASYAIEGGGSKQYIKTRQLMIEHRCGWDRLMNKLVTVQADYLIEQAKHGADALQIFDSWLANALSCQQVIEYVMPYNRLLIEKVRRSVEVPIIYFSLAGHEYLQKIRLLNRCFFVIRELRQSKLVLKL